MKWAGAVKGGRTFPQFYPPKASALMNQSQSLYSIGAVDAAGKLSLWPPRA